ncbi:XRE family transcriptional regulator [Nioella sp. MMSF_3534]|uniref:LexA family transcriptional regulator n=1 Tax=Nioella sp. MMSF_3534 TaxID=3046720 RepID=UPI00273F2170|nr:XRE family transcriptional regulator [Nioella sp. MMSF_3534]
MELEELAKLVEERRKQLNMSMADVHKIAFPGTQSTAIQNLKRGIPPNFTTLSRLCDALGLKFSIEMPGLRPSKVAHATGFAEAQVAFEAKSPAPVSTLKSAKGGWAEPESAGFDFPLPSGAGGEGAFYVQLADGSIAAPGIPNDATLLVQGNREAGAGDLALLVDRDGLQAVRRIREIDGNWIKTSGYLPQKDGTLEMHDDRHIVGIVHRYPIVAAFAKPPSPDQLQENLLTGQVGSSPVPAPAGSYIPVPFLDEEGHGPLAFRQDFLDRLGVSPDAARLVSVKGDAMAPTLGDGDLALIEATRTAVRNGRIYAFVDQDGTNRITRLDRPEKGMLVVRSDNPASPVEFRKEGQVEVKGEVLWWGRVGG